MKKILISLAALALASTCAARQPEKGYRGFIDWSNDIASRKLWSGLDDRSIVHYWGFSTSHGYQFNPRFYLGAGLVYEYSKKLDSHILAPFLHGRTDLLFGKFTPFGEIKLGYNLSQDGGIYFSPQIGYRFNWGRKMGINVGAGLTLTGYSTTLYDIAMSPEGYWTAYPKGSYRSSETHFSFSIGIDF